MPPSSSRRRQPSLSTLATTATTILLSTTATGSPPVRTMARASLAFTSPLHALPRCIKNAHLHSSPFHLPSQHARSDLLRRHAYAKGRPSLDDVERLSHGQAAKKRGTGSRNICHRLNEMERKEFDLAKKMGFVQLRGTGYRRERKGSPLANIHRQLCDALGRPCIEVHRGLGTDAVDEVVVDLSPYRPVQPVELDSAWEVCVALEEEFLSAAASAVSQEGDGTANASSLGEQEGSEVPSLRAKWERMRESFEEEDWEKKPIWELPVLAYVYNCTGDRGLAKKVAQEAHARLAKLPRKR